MAKEAPSPVDIQDFQFKLHCHLKIFNNEDASVFGKPCSLVACASRYGLIFVGSNNFSFQVIQISSIENYSDSGYYGRVISLPSYPKHLSVNCDCTKLAIVTEKDGCALALFYDITSFTKQEVNIIQQLPLSTKIGTNVLECCWNPTVSNIFSACMDDGTLGVYELKEHKINKNELPMEAQATCMNWSPKGKQLAVGSRNGKITQYKPDLKAMKIINAPPLQGIHHVISLQWISNYQFIAVFKPPDPDSNANLLVIDAPKTGDVVYTNYEDICYGYGSVRPPQFYTIYQSAWNLLIAASSNSIEVGVLGCRADQWIQWILSDTARAELPLTLKKRESLPIGLAFDTSATRSVVWGETSLPPAPFLLVLSHEGLLCCFRVINMQADTQSVCQKPETLTDNLGLNQFELFSPEGNESSPKNEPVIQSIKPVVSETPSFFKPTAKIETIILPSPSIPQSLEPSIVQNVGRIEIPLAVKSVPEVLPIVMSPIATVAPLQLNETNMIQKEADMLIANLIREECETLEAELKSLLNKSKLLKIDLGTDAEAVELVREADALQDFLAEVVEINSAQSTEIYTLKQALIQTWAWYEDARFRLAETRDTTLETLHRLQQLDPVSKRYMSDIKQVSYYLDTQIQLAGQVLDDQWSNFQDKCKKIVRTKIPTMETIYQSMVRHSVVLEKQKYILKDISNRNRALRSRLSGPSLLMSLNNIDLLEKSLKRLQLEPEQHFLEAQCEMVLRKQKHFTQAKSDKLIALLKNRDITNVKINKPQLANVTANLQTLLKSSPRINKSVDASLIGAGLSPITTKTGIFSNAIVQSTPKSSIAGINRGILTNQEQSPMITTTVTENNQSRFISKLPQSDVMSAFVSTTPPSYSFPNKTTVSSTSTFTFGNTSIFSVGTSTDTKIDKKGLLPTKPEVTIFATTSSSVFGSSPPNLFSFSKSTAPFTFPSKAISTAAFSFTPSSPSTTFTTKLADGAPAFNFSMTTSSTSVSTTTPNLLFQSTGNSSSVSGSLFNISSTSLKPLTTATFLPSTGSSNLTSTVSSSSASNLFSTSTVPDSFGSKASNTFFNTLTSDNLSSKTTTTSAISVLTNKDVTSSTIGSNLFDSTKTASSVIATTVASTPTTIVIEIMGGSPSITTVSSSMPITTTINMFSNASTITPIKSPVFSSNAPTNTTTSLFNLNTPSEKLESKFSTSNTITTTGPIVSLPGDSKLSMGVSTPVATSQTLFGSVSTASIFGSPSINAATVTATPSISIGTTHSNIFGGIVPTSSAFASNSENKTTTPFGSGPPNTTSGAFQTTPGQFFGDSTPLVSQNIFGNANSSLPVNAFGIGVPSTTQSLFDATNKPPILGATTTTASFSFASAAVSNANLFNSVTTSAGSSIFGSAPTTTTSLFGAPISSPMTSSIFGGQSTQTGSIFGGATSTTTSVFGTATSKTNPVFGTAASTSASVFGGVTSSTASPVFGAGATTPAPVFGLGASTTTPIFGAAASTTSSVFGGTPSTTASVFGAAVSKTTPAFGVGASTTTPVFGAPVSTTASVFGSPTTSSPIFGSSPFSNSGSSAFGSTNKPAQFGTSPTGSIFGQQSTFGSSSAFGSPVATSVNTFGTSNSVFGNPQTSESFGSSGFAKPFSFTLPPATTNSGSFGFGNLNMGASNSAFSGQDSNPFSKAFSQEQKPFGGGSLFGTPSSTSSFGSTTTSTFGLGSTSGFSSPAFGQQSQFGQQTSAFGNTQPGPFSGGNQSVAQSGFGGFSQQSQKSGFGAAPMFGGSPTGFGSTPSFGGSAFNTSFGSPNKVFGESNSQTSGFGTPSPPQQQNSTFANMASQNTIGFGALAQQSPQSQSSTAFSPGSSFSTWR